MSRRDWIEMGKGLFIFFGISIVVAIILGIIDGEEVIQAAGLSFNLGISTVTTMLLYTFKSKYTKKYSPKILAIRVSLIYFTIFQIIPLLILVIVWLTGNKWW